MIATTCAWLALALAPSPLPQDPPRLEVHATEALVRPPGHPRPGVGDEPLDDSTLRAGVERLAALVVDHVQPPLEAGRELVEASGTSLVVLARDAQHRWIEDFLARQRATLDELVSVRIELLEGPAGCFDAVLGGTTAAAVPDAQREALVARAAGGQGELELVTAPYVVTRHRWPVNVKVMDPVDYVSAWRRRVVQPGDQELVFPIVETLQPGVEIDLSTCALVGPGYLLDVRVQRSKVVRPIPTRLAPVEEWGVPAVEVGAPPAPIEARDLREVAAPEERRVDFESSMVLTPDAIMGLLASMPAAASQPERDLLVLIRFEVPTTAGDLHDR